ncbi:DUF4224 domain-containing protein [Paraburkholderia caribensis]|uniref:DUF4224 domain-containing protein n=1 Tax=Paraburkholderia caribensis TaxID=75105 RepID=UPI00285D72E8|nr:DUF4224 domain-containing protein [Paraburkholderia caribensis]MDR6383990.1 hypothetical protein [Paraburkholderia caribensis]
MSDDDLRDVTGKKRHSKQAEWFRHQFGIEVPKRHDGSIVITWATFEALQNKKVGTLRVDPGIPLERPPVYPLRRAAA